MISKLVKKVGPYSITRDNAGLHTLLDAKAKPIATSKDIDMVEAAAEFLDDMDQRLGTSPGLTGQEVA